MSRGAAAALVLAAGIVTSPAARAEEAAAPPPAGAETAAPAPLKKFELIGDFRYRHESTEFGAPERDTRHRERLRLRAGLHFRPSAELTITAQLQTGERDDPKSPHITLGNAFRTLPINLSLASLTWQPRRLEGLRLSVGKFATPLAASPVYGEMVWDQDLRPEGGFVAYARPRGPVRFGATTGYFLIEERAQGKDAGAWVGQAFGSGVIGAVELRLTFGYYHFDRTISREPGRLLALAPGNRTLDTTGDAEPDRFASDFHLWHPIASLQLDLAGRPLVLSGEYVRNTGASAGDDGFGLGLAWGATRRRGDWQAYYQYLRIEPDAVFALVSQDDLTRATDLRGHVFGARVQLLEKTGVNAWVLAAEPTEAVAGGRDWRFRVDLNVAY